MGLKQIRVLLVEDDEDDYLLIQEWLKDIRNGNFRLDWIDRGKEALRYLQENSPDVILMDYKLIHENGLQLSHQIRNTGVYIPTVLITSADKEEVGGEEAIKNAAEGFLRKSDLSAGILEQAILSLTQAGVLRDR